MITGSFPVAAVLLGLLLAGRKTDRVVEVGSQVEI